MSGMPEPTLFDAVGAPPADASAAPGPAAAPVPSPAVVADPWTGHPTLLAVDGNSLVHRAFHGYARDARDDDEALHEALRGMLALLVGVVDRVGPDRLCVGFDDDRSERALRYPAYKAVRNPKVPALRATISAAPALVEELGVSVVTCDGWEADDVLASAARAATSAGLHAVLATSDRDAFGLIRDDVTLLRLRTGLGAAVVVTPQVLRREVGVDPQHYVELAAMRGDTSDNLPGLAGIGRTRAAALLTELGSIEAAAVDPIGCRSVLGRDLGQALLDDLAAPDSVVRRNLALMAARDDLPIDLDGCGRGCSPEQIAERLVRRGLGTMAARVAVALAR